MRRLWPVTRIVLLLAVGYLAVEGGGGYATVAVLAWWVAYWGLRDDLRWEPVSQPTVFTVSAPLKWGVGDMLHIGQIQRPRVITSIKGRNEVVCCYPGRWVR